MATNNFQITDLDFENIKSNLKTFLNAQSEFQDYDFEGSGLSVLLDILAYNTHYNAMYLNLVANESFLDSSTLRESVISHVKTLGYIPTSKTASRAVVNMTIETDNEDPETLSLTSDELVFVSNSSEIGQIYRFRPINDINIEKVGSSFYLKNLILREGEIINNDFIYNVDDNPKSIFTITDKDADTSTIKVDVQESISNTYTESYTLSSDILTIDDTSNVYFLQEDREGYYSIYFGDNVLGKKLKDGNIVKISYYSTSGADADGVTDFSLQSSSINSAITGYISNTIELVSKSSGGASKESIDSMKKLAPMLYTAQNRIVTLNDYNSYILKNYPYAQALSVWGGEEETPPVFGKVFVSIKAKDNYYLSEQEKENILNDIIKPKSMPTIKCEIIDPDYLYLLMTSNVKYRKNRTTLTEDGIKQKVRLAIESYNDNELNTFEVYFINSKLEQAINDSDKSIIGTDNFIRLQKRFTPKLNSKSNYQINFNTPIKQGSSKQYLTSSEFVMKDSNFVERTVIIEEIPKSSSGITEIQIDDAGYNYTFTPTVTIVGDGRGALAEAYVKNGRIEKIVILNPGIDYTTASIVIEEPENGKIASASAILDSNIGIMRVVYYNSNSERVILETNIGSINYNEGIVTLNDLSVFSLNTSDGKIRLTCGSDNGLIQSRKNVILTIDENDGQSIVINTESVE